MMTRKQYRWFARWLATTQISEHRINELCDYFVEDNRAFKRDLFLFVYNKHKVEYDEYNRQLKERLRA